MTGRRGGRPAPAAAAAGAVVERIAREWAVPGVVIAVTDRKRVVWQHVTGYADLARGVPLRTDHLLEIGSISKIATAMVVLQTIAAGGLRLEQPIGEALPWVPAPLRDPAITLRTLLTHTAGLVGSVDALPDERAQIAAYAEASPVPPGAPGSRFHYSNVGYLLLGLAASSAAGRPLPELVREQVFRPAGMVDAAPVITSADAGRLASGHQPLAEDLPWRPGDPLVAAPLIETAGSDGSIAATVADLAALARVLLREGEGDAGVVLDRSSFAAMTGTLAPEGEEVLVLPGTAAPEWSRYGLGINVEQTPRGPVLSHGGGMVGFASFLLADPAAGRAVVVLTNADGDSPVAEALARSVDAVFERGGPGAEQQGLSGVRWARPSSGRGPGPHVSVRPPALPAAALGVFHGTDGRRLEVLAAGDGHDVVLDGRSAALRWTWSDRCLTTLPELRRFALVFDGTAWTWGAEEFRPEHGAGGAPDPAAGPALPSGHDIAAVPGHYRSYTPWYPHLRIVRRRSGLVLIAPRGVEAPAEDHALVPLGGGAFRIGEDPAAPEILRVGPVIDGGCAWIDRDGCRYSRSFTA
ncbi:beta-lactamase family protein [Leifsonia sp. ZF2019]|uniref:serine hydrolase domain-containing protein n=1 Tax=Leifsonia sp. ZF2019 TaxID=2781978 RepID=UPI001CBC0CF3|nr:serine hydrolase domain-containing protein [Leifsonia sp. ZF2019]UAJ79838.1 beta-lactamase family protein [Leifsonia sp. ZF2019]